MIRYRDLSVKNPQRKRILKSIEKVLESGMILNSNEIEELENKIAKYCDRKYAIAVSSGTSALYLTLKSLGIGEGDEVITTCLSVVPNGNSNTATGATPVFVDIDDDMNINIDLIKEKIGENTKAIVIVDYTGKICRGISNLHHKFHIPIIEDASQAFGAIYDDKRAGSFGLMSCISLNAMKVFGSCGEAGIILLDDKTLYEDLKCMRYNGLVTKTKSNYIELNHRMNVIQATILLERFKSIDKLIETRQKLANYYNKNLEGIVIIPTEYRKGSNVYFTYNIRVHDRDGLHKYLMEKGIETQVRDDVLLPFLLPIKRDYSKYNFPIGNKISKESISLPIHEHLTYKEIDYICKEIKSYLKMEKK